MPVGLPAKTTYANGDVFSASDINDTNGTINLIGQTNNAYAGKNAIINGAFNIWQRGTSFSTPALGTYVADRFSCLNTNTATTLTTVSRQNTSDTTNLSFIQYCLRYQRNSGSTGTAAVYLTQSLETVNSIPFAGKSVTFSFYARRGANYSSSSNLLLGELNSGTGTDQNINTGFTGSAQVAAISASLTTTWQRFTFTGTVSSTATQLGFYLYYTPTGTAGAADFFEVTGIQLELGSTATAFTRAGGTIQGELAACQRYYYRQTAFSAFGPMLHGFETGSTSANGYFNLPVTLRNTPSAVDYSTLFVNDQSGNITVTAITIGNSSQNLVNLSISAASGMVAGRPFQLLANNSTSAYLGVSAEL